MREHRYRAFRKSLLVIAACVAFYLWRSDIEKILMVPVAMWNKASTAIEMHLFADEIQRYHLLKGRFPGQYEFEKFVTDNFYGDPDDVLRDGWGEKYRYSVSYDGGGFEIVSAGADGKFGTPDDLTVQGGKSR